jgi:hypothetical protein
MRMGGMSSSRDNILGGGGGGEGKGRGGKV